MRAGGDLLILLSAIFFGLGGLFFKFIPWSALAINCCRCFIAGVVLLITALVSKHKLVINKNVICAGTGICITNNLFALANKLTTAGNAIVLQFTMPVYVILIYWVLYKKKPKKMDVMLCFTVLLGIALFFIDSLSAGGMLGNCLALCSGFTYACYFTFNTQKDSDPLTSILLAYAGSVVIDFPFLLKTDFTQAPEGYPLWTAFAAVAALGLIQQGLAQFCFTRGIKKTTAVTAAIVSGVEPILNPIMVAIFVGEVLSPLSIVGAVIVLASIVSHKIIEIKIKEKKQAK